MKDLDRIKDFQIKKIQLILSNKDFGRGMNDSHPRMNDSDSGMNGSDQRMNGSLQGMNGLFQGMNDLQRSPDESEGSHLPSVELIRRKICQV